MGKLPIIGIVSGYFDPLHVGHLENIELAKKLCDRVVVIVNNDNQAILKKGKPFMSQEDRLKIMESLRDVDAVILSVDQDKSVCLSLREVVVRFGQAYDYYFCKGGDRFAGEIPESEVCRQLNIKIVDGLGAKIRASSELIANSNITQSVENIKLKGGIK